MMDRSERATGKAFHAGGSIDAQLMVNDASLKLREMDSRR